MDNEVISFLMVIVEVQSGIYLSFYFGCILVIRVEPLRGSLGGGVLAPHCTAFVRGYQC